MANTTCGRRSRSAGPTGASSPRIHLDYCQAMGRRLSVPTYLVTRLYSSARGVCAMKRGTTNRQPWTVRVGVMLAALVGLAAPRAVGAEQAAARGEVTFTKDIAPILQRSCENCHRADGVAPDVALDLRGGPAVGARHQAAHRHRPARRRDAALVRREEHRHPAVQERPVAERRGDRQDRQVGRQRRAARQPGRHAAAEGLRRRQRRGRSARPI